MKTHMAREFKATRSARVTFGRLLILSTLIWGCLTPRMAAAQQHSEFPGVRRHVATVIFCGLGGAVLGLSTLSFYGKPQDHTGNIYAGLGVGLVAGAIYIMMGPVDGASAGIITNKPQRVLSEFQDLPRLQANPVPVPVAAYAWTF